MTFLIELADIVIQIETKHMSIYDSLKEYLVLDKEPLFFVATTKETLDYEWRQDTLFDGLENSTTKIGIEPLLERSAIFRIIANKLLSFHVMMMHGVVVSDGGYGYMFTAPSGTGKTTRGNLFVEHYPGSFVLNGDKPLIRAEENQIIACGSPWKGKEGYGINAEVPLKAIFLLERAEQTEVTELTLSQAFDSLLRQTLIPSTSASILNIIRLMKSMEGKVRFFRFRSTPTVESVEAAWRAANDL